MDVVGVRHVTVNQMVVVGDHWLAKEIACDDGAGFVPTEAFAVIAKNSEPKPATSTYFLLCSAGEVTGIPPSIGEKFRQFFKLFYPDRTLKLSGADVVSWKYEAERRWYYAKFVVLW
jgi:hypothetical protein